MIAPPPVPTPFSGPQTPSLGWVNWFQSITAALKISFGDGTGIGSGALANIQAPAHGSGLGPSNPATVVQWVQVQVGDTAYWTPLFR